MNCSRHAAVLGYQTVKRLDGLGIAQDAGNGPSVGRIGGLALCAGLGLHLRSHQVGSQVNEGRGDCKMRIGVAHKNAFAAKLNNYEAVANFGNVRAVELNDLANFHFISPKRANPADESSSHVTSDNATAVRRENNQWSNL